MSDQFDLDAYARTKPYAHQNVGVEHLLARSFAMLADEMGAGKTKQVIDAAQVLYIYDKIDRVLVLAPASVRGVWFDPELGELAKHLWTSQRGDIIEWHARRRGWQYGPAGGNRLKWLITNYEFIRQAARLKELLAYCTPKTLLVLDESSAVKNYRAQQTKAAFKLRQACGRVVLLNGTPISHSPGDMYAQGMLMHPKILDCQNYFHFRSRYAIMGGWQGRQVISWINLEDMQRRFAPYVLRRLKSQCLDLPPKIESVPLEPSLTPATWRIYKEMKAQMVAWLSTATAAMASQAGVKALRLAQITSGFVGGVTEVENESPQDHVQMIGSEKLDCFLDWFSRTLEEDRNIKLLVWCRFRPELMRLYMTLAHAYPRLELGKIWGGQTRQERDDALRLLDPRTTPSGPAVVVGTPQSGALGLNLTAAHTVVYMSNDYSLKTRLQSEDRVHRPGQTSPVSYFDVIATGPRGERTIDHIILKALRTKQNLAEWTTRAWITALEEE